MGLFSDSVTALDPYVPPTVITEEGEAEEGTWHAMFEVDARGAEVALTYGDYIRTLPSPISEEVKWENLSVTDLCNVMDLTTESPYTLPVLPPTLVEEFRTDVFPVTLVSNHFHLWLRVLQSSGHPDDKIEIFINGNLEATTLATDLDDWRDLGTWYLWHLTLSTPLPVADAKVSIKVTTRTDVANPTLVLFGAIDINNTASPANPFDTDSINLFDYSSNLGAAEDLAKSIFDLSALGITLEAPLAAQNWVARAGGLGTPYLAANMRTDGSVISASDTINFMFEDYDFGDIPLTSLDNTACERSFFPLPSHLMNTPGRPRIRTTITSAGNSRVIVDDFTLSYVTKVLEDEYPELAAASNIIPNGGFEKGNYPFLVESPVANPVNCPHISDVILASPEVCHESYAAEFKSTLNLVLWMRCPQTGINTDQIEIIILDSNGVETIIDTVYPADVTPAWAAHSFPFTRQQAISP